MRALHMLVLAAFVLVPLAGAAEPGARPIVGPSAATNVIDVAETSGRFALGTQDPSSRFISASDPNPNPDARVWYLYNADGLNVLAEDDADPPSCSETVPPVSEDCRTHVRHLAVNAAGTRIIVASEPSDGSSTLIFADDRQGLLARRSVTGDVRGVAISDDGAFAVVITAPIGVGGTSRLHAFTWSGTIQAADPVALADPPTTLAMSPDGLAVVVGAAGKHYRFGRDTTLPPNVDNNFPGQVTQVSMSGRADHISIAGSSEGRFVLYTDTSATDRRELNVPLGSTSINKVAIRHDGTAVALGDSNNKVVVYALNADPILLGAKIGEVTMAGPVRALEFSRDGDELVVVAGPGGAGVSAQTRMFAVTDKLTELWRHDLASVTGHVSVAKNGDVVGVGTSSGIQLYDAIRAVTPALPASVAIEPGKYQAFEFNIKNDGNRRETRALSLTGPTGWNMGIAPLNIALLPGESVKATVAFELPAQHAPGDHSITIKIGSVEHTVPIKVKEVVSWQMQASGATSKAVKSGDEVGFAFNVTNNGNVATTPPLALQGLTDGWQATFDPTPAAIEPGATVDYVLKLKAPSDALDLAVGEVTVNLTGNDGLHVRATVGATFGLSLEVPGNLVVVAGNATPFDIVVRNDANAVDTIRVGFSSLPTGWSATMPGGLRDEVINDFPAGTTRTLRATITVPADAVIDGQVLLVVQGVSFGDPTKTASRTVLVTVEEPPAPTTNGKDSPLPVAVVLGALAIALARRRL